MKSAGSPSGRELGAVVGVAGCGVTGAQVAALLAGSSTEPDGRRIGVAVYDTDPSSARRLAAAIGGVAVDRVEDLAVADVVAFCQPDPHADLAAEFIRAGVSVVSTGDSVDDIRELLTMDGAAQVSGASLAVGSAMAPGLSGLLARSLAAQLAVVDELHVAINGTGGPACARQHHVALGGRALAWHEGEWVQRPGGSGRELCWFPEPMGASDCYRAAHADPMILHDAFPSAGRISARLAATRRDRITARLPMLTPPHSGGNIGAVRVEARGSLAGGERVTVISGAAGRTAQLAAAVCAGTVQACLAGVVPPGAASLADSRIDFVDLLDRATGFGVRVQEFTGVARATSW